MYLKSIEVHGFKSFANKIVFDFHNGITGIVGPNGSGKSNVADAVRWVLGEQKVKQLRSSSMQDVIFAGTENRKPQSYAYAAITLDNSDHQLALDYEEVTVARRVYRSGESEYLINGTACRLKDVNELFYDTGIGKEGYSIIGQGQIDKILGGKPEERRELFDEAAGIVKYKRRKQTAQKKLESEEQNLVRVNDILSELGRQLAPLEKQSETAREYLKKKEELKSYDVNAFLLETEKVNRELSEAEEQYQIAKEHQEQTKDAFEKIRNQYEQMENAIGETEDRIEQMRQEMNQAGTDKEKLEGQLNVLKEQIHSIENNEENLKERLKSMKEDEEARIQAKETYEQEKCGFLADIQKIQQKKETAYQQISECKNEIVRCEELIENGKNEILKLMDEKASLRARQQHFDTIAEQTAIRQAQIHQKLLTQKSAEEELQSVFDGHKAKKDEIEAEIAGLKSRESEIESKLDGWKIKSQEAVKTLEQAREQYHKDRSRLESLKNIAERYDGYGISIRKIMEKRAENPGIHGVVADIIKVDKQYQTAIETSLGGSIQNIVTEDEETAKALISYLKRNKLGRATFLPLTSVKKRDGFSQAGALKEPGVIGLADTLVETKEKYRGIIGYLLGRTLVVDHIDHATAIAGKYRYSLRIVTLEGESLQPGGSMTGGAFKNNSNLLGRSGEIQQLSGKVKEAEELIGSTSSRLEDIRTARELLKEDLAAVREEMQQKKLSLNTVKLNLEHAREEICQHETFYQNIQNENQDIKEQLLNAKEEKEKISQIIALSEERTHEIEEESEAVQKLLDKQNQEESRLQAQLSEILMEDAALRQKEEFIIENIQRVEGELQKLADERKMLTDSFRESDADIQKKQRDMEEIGKTIAEAVRVHQKLEVCVKELQEKKESMSADYKGYFKEREELSGQIGELDKEIFRLQAKKEKLEESLERQSSYMWEEYELTYHAALPLKNPEYQNLADMKKQMIRLREEIRKLGIVNVNAIEEYKTVSERFHFMDNQRNDLEEAKKTLIGIIEELDQGMRRQFNEKFAEIQREFDKAFKDLFGGGRGTLELTEDGDVLECGVRIIAQPPGKKLQNMMQLSGGEKSLTAIALLFAIQNLKPSPFCLLDEIEAALDDSNVVRFARYLNKLTKNTQFIIITHRRGTMSAADRLYGITMQEKGVSTLVSVSLIEHALDA
ncbi:Chromosome partition protein Smc [uncultured Roseburia sp.]|uniref:Chromosome partition protein Smc n=1 Tax=Brotonthovivens ammoniilytica TaxID=2981725 RepID=A0ABT2TMK4_9FIRM|nr:chromosome segregation protein SMC [Brotonthovivens ammoniilytica]MCU6763455.1 chromosome segregation protein SMC [Brotonthovivens ammoniilytica]SCJ19864.1 Chromosome partition protein Smc [uncultured Roseburia sp.]